MRYATEELRSIDSLLRQGRFLEARAAAETYASARPAEEGGPARGQLAFVLGKVFRNLGDYGAAEREYLSAAEAFRIAGDEESTADALSGAALTRWQLCDFVRAVELQLDALRVYERIGDRLGLANAHNTLGLIAWKRADYPEALGRFESALALYEELSHAQGLAATVNNLGGAVQDSGDLERSAGYYAEAERLYRRAGDSAGAALAAGNLAWTLASLGRAGEAAPFAELAMTGFAEAGDSAGLYRALMQRAAVFAAGGERRKAALDLYRAARGARDLGCVELESTALQDLVDVLGSLGLHRRVGTWYRRILALERELRSEAREREIARLRLDMELEFREKEEERLRAALRDRDRLLSALVHDARAAALGLRDSLAALGFELPALGPPEARRRIASAEERASELMAGLDSSLAWARARDGSLEPVLAPLPAPRSIKAALAAFRAPMADRGMEVELDCPEPGPTILADCRLLGLVLSNAISNALEHGSGPLRVSVRDEAGSVAMALRNAVPERRAPNGSAAPVGGHGAIRGLGLALCSELCARMGGEFRFNAEGGFAEALIVLPSGNRRPSSTS